MKAHQQNDTSIEIEARLAKEIDRLFPNVRGRANKMALLVNRVKEQENEISYLKGLILGFAGAKK